MAQQPGLNGVQQFRKKFGVAVAAHPDAANRSVLQSVLNDSFAGVKSEQDLTRAGLRLAGFLNRNQRKTTEAIDSLMGQVAQMGLTPEQLVEVRKQYEQQAKQFFQPFILPTKEILQSSKVSVDDKYKMTGAEKTATDISLGARRTGLGAIAGTALDAFTGPMYLPQGYQENKWVSGTAQAIGLAGELAAPGTKLLGAAGKLLGAEGVAARLGGEAGLRLAGQGVGQAARSPGIMGLRELAKKALQGDAGAKAALRTRAIVGGSTGAGAGAALGLTQTAAQELPGARPIMGDLGNERVAAPTLADYARGIGMGALGGGLGGMFAGAVGPVSSRLGAAATEVGSELVGAVPDAATQYLTTGTVDPSGLLPGVFAAGTVGAATGPHVGPTQPAGATPPPLPGQAREARAWTGEELLARKRMEPPKPGDTVTISDADGNESSYTVLVGTPGRREIRVRDAEGNEFILNTDPNVSDDPRTLASRLQPDTTKVVGRQRKALAGIMAGTEEPAQVGDALQVVVAGQPRQYMVDEVRGDGVLVLRDSNNKMFELDVPNIDNPSDVAGRLFGITTPGQSVVDSSNAVRSSVGRMVIADTVDAETGQTRSNAYIIDAYDPGTTDKDKRRGGLVTFTELRTGRQRQMPFRKFTENYGTVRAYNPFEDAIAQYRDAGEEGSFRSEEQSNQISDLVSNVADEIQNADRSGYGDAARRHVAMLAEELRAEQRSDMAELAGWIKLNALSPEAFARQYNEQEFAGQSPDLLEAARKQFGTGAAMVADRIMQLPNSAELAGITDGNAYKAKYKQMREQLLRTKGKTPDTFQYIQAVEIALDILRKRQKGKGAPETPITKLAQEAEAEVKADMPVAQEAPPEQAAPVAEAEFTPDDIVASAETTNIFLASLEEALASDNFEGVAKAKQDLQDSFEAGYITPQDKQRFDQAVAYIERGESIPETLYEAPAPTPPVAAETKAAPKTPAPTEEPKPPVAPTETPAPKAETAAPTGREVRVGGGRGNPVRTFLIEEEFPDGSMTLRNKSPRGNFGPAYNAPADSKPVVMIREKEAKQAAAAAETPAPKAPEVKAPEAKVPETKAETPAPKVPETKAETPAPKAAETPAPNVPETPAPKAAEAPAATEEKPTLVDPRSIDVPTKARELLSKGRLTSAEKAAQLGIERMREAASKGDAEAVTAEVTKAKSDVERYGKNERPKVVELQALLDETNNTIQQKLPTAEPTTPKTPKVRTRKVKEPGVAPAPTEAPISEETKAAGTDVVQEAPTETGPVTITEVKNEQFYDPLGKTGKVERVYRVVYLSNDTFVRLERVGNKWYEALEDIATSRPLADRWVGNNLDEAKNNILNWVNRPAPEKPKAPTVSLPPEEAPVYRDVYETIPAPEPVALAAGSARISIPAQRRYKDYAATKALMERQRRGEPVKEEDFYEQVSPERQYEVDGFDADGNLLVRPVGKNGAVSTKVESVPKNNPQYLPLKTQYERALVDEAVSRLPELPSDAVVPADSMWGQVMQRAKEAAIVNPQQPAEARNAFNQLRERIDFAGIPKEFDAPVRESLDILSSMLEGKPRRRKTGQELVSMPTRVPTELRGGELEDVYRRLAADPTVEAVPAMDYELADDPYQAEVQRLRAAIQDAEQTGDVPTATSLTRELKNLRQQKVLQHNAEQEIETDYAKQERERLRIARTSKGTTAPISAEDIKEWAVTDGEERPVLPADQEPEVEAAVAPELKRMGLNEATIAAMEKARDGRRPDLIQQIAEEQYRKYDELTLDAARATMDRILDKITAEDTRTPSAKTKDSKKQFDEDIARLQKALSAPIGQNEYELELADLNTKLSGDPKEAAKETIKQLREDAAAEKERRKGLEREKKALEKEMKKADPATQEAYQKQITAITDELQTPMMEVKDVAKRLADDRVRMENRRNELERATRPALQAQLNGLQADRKKLAAELDDIKTYREALDEQVKRILNERDQFWRMLSSTDSIQQVAEKMLGITRDKNGKPQYGSISPGKYAAAEKIVSTLREVVARTRNRYRAERENLRHFQEALLNEAQSQATLIPLVADNGDTKFYQVSYQDNNYWMVREVDENGYPVADANGNYPLPRKESAKGKFVRSLKRAAAGGDSDEANRPEGRYVVDANGLEFVVLGPTPDNTGLVVYKKRGPKWKNTPEIIPAEGSVAKNVRRAEAIDTLSEMTLAKDELAVFEAVANHTLQLSEAEVLAARDKLVAMGPQAQARFYKYEEAIGQLLDSSLIVAKGDTGPIRTEKIAMGLAEERGNIPVETSGEKRPLSEMDLPDLIDRYQALEMALRSAPLEVTEPDGTKRLYRVRKVGAESQTSRKIIEETVRQFGGTVEEKKALRDDLLKDALIRVSEIDENGNPVGNDFSLLDLRFSEEAGTVPPEKLAQRKKSIEQRIAKLESTDLSKARRNLELLKEQQRAPAGENYYEKQAKKLQAEVSALATKLRSLKNPNTKAAKEMAAKSERLTKEINRLNSITRGVIGDKIVALEDQLAGFQRTIEGANEAMFTEPRRPLYPDIVEAARRDADNQKKVAADPALQKERQRLERSQQLVRGEVLLRGKRAIQEFNRMTGTTLKAAILGGAVTLMASPAYAATNGFTGGNPARALELLGYAAAHPGAALAGLSAAAIAGATVFAAKQAGGFHKFLRTFSQRPEIAEYLRTVKSGKERLAIYRDMRTMWDKAGAIMQAIAYGASTARGGLNAVINTALRGAGEQFADFRQLTGKPREEFLRYFNDGLRGAVKEVWRQTGRPRVSQAVQDINDYLLAGGHDAFAGQLNSLTGMDRLAVNERLADLLSEADTQRNVVKQIANKYGEDLTDRINTPADRERLHRFLLIETSDLTPAERIEYEDFLNDDNIMQMRQELDEVADRVAAMGGISAGARAAYRGRFLQNFGTGMTSEQGVAGLGRQLLDLLAPKRNAAQVGQRKSEYRGVSQQGFKSSEARDEFLSEHNKEWMIQDTYDMEDGEYVSLASVDGQVLDVRREDLNNYNVEGRSQKWRKVDDLRNGTFKAVRDLTPEEIEAKGVILNGPQAVVNTLRTLANQERRFGLAKVIAADPEYATSARTSDDLNKNWGLRQWGKNKELGVFEITGIESPDGRVEVIPVDPTKARTLINKPKPLNDKSFSPSVQFNNAKWDVVNFDEDTYTIRRGSEVLTVPANTVRPFKLLSVPEGVRQAANGIGSFKPNEFNYGMLNDTYVSPDVYILMESLTKENGVAKAANWFNRQVFGTALWKKLAIAQNAKSLVAQTAQNYGMLNQNGVTPLELPYYAMEFGKDRDLVAEVERLGLFTDMGSIEASGGAATGPRTQQFKAYNPRQLFTYEIAKQLAKTENPSPADYAKALYTAAHKQGYKNVTRAIPGLIQYQDALARFSLQRAFEQDNLAKGLDIEDARKAAVKQAIEVSYRTNYNPALTALSKTFVPFANVWAYNAFVQPYVALTNPVGFLLGKVSQAIVASVFGAEKDDEEKEIIDVDGTTRKLSERDRREMVDKFLRPRGFEFTTTDTPQTTRIGNTIIETGRFDPGRGSIMPEVGGTAGALVKAGVALTAAANQQPGAFREALQALSMQRGAYAPPTTSETPAAEDISNALTSVAKAYFPMPYNIARIAEPGRRQNFDRGLAGIQTLVTAYNYDKTSLVRTLLSKQQQEITNNNRGKSRAFYDTNDPKKRAEITKDYAQREVALRKKYGAILRVIGSLSARNPEADTEEAKALVGAGAK